MKKVKYSDNISKILKALEQVPAKLIEYKKLKNSPLVIIQNGKIVHIKPEDL